MKAKKFNKNQLLLLNKLREDEKTFIYETIQSFLDKGKPSSLKSIEAQELQRKTQAEDIMKKMTEHLDYSFNSFRNACNPTEKKTLRQLG